MSPDTEMAAVSSQHPDIGQALAEIVGGLTERQTVAPSITFVGLSGRYATDAPEIGQTIHTLLQSERTLVFCPPGLAGGGRILDPSGSAAVFALADTEVTLDMDPMVAPASRAATTARTGSAWFAPSTANSEDAVISVTAGEAAGPLWLFEGDHQARCDELVATLHSVNPVLTTSVGATPVGLPSPATLVVGQRVLKIDNMPARSMIMNCLELDGAEVDGPSIDFPRMMIEVLGEDEPPRRIAVTGSGVLDDSITLSQPLRQGSVIQVARHDPDLAANDVVGKQRHRRHAAPRLLLLSSDLPPGATTNLIGSAAEVLSADLVGVLERPDPGPGLPWPSASVLTLR